MLSILNPRQIHLLIIIFIYQDLLGLYSLISRNFQDQPYFHKLWLQSLENQEKNPGLSSRRCGKPVV